MLNYIHQMPSQETFQPPALPCVSFTLDEADVKYHSYHSKTLSTLISRVNAFNDHKLLMLSQHLSQVNMVEIYLPHKLIGGLLSHLQKNIPVQGKTFKSMVLIEPPGLAQNFQGLTTSPSEVLFFLSYDNRLAFFQQIDSHHIQLRKMR